MKPKPSILRETGSAYKTAPQPQPPETMVRTQIYLTQKELQFAQQEAARRQTTMAAVIRQWIDEKMVVADDLWANSPLLQPPAEDFDGPKDGDGAINHDHYIYGGPKKYKRVKGKWVHLPMLP